MSAFTDRLIEIAEIDNGGGYEWEEWHAYYDPQTRKYHTGSGSGCSCDCYEIGTYTDESNGLVKNEVLRDLNAFVDDSYRSEVTDADVARAQNAVRDFKPPKGV